MSGRLNQIWQHNNVKKCGVVFELIKPDSRAKIRKVALKLIFERSLHLKFIMVYHNTTILMLGASPEWYQGATGLD